MNLHYIDILDLGFMSYGTQSYRQSLLGLLFSLLYCALCKPSDLVGLVKKGFNSMLILGLSF